MLRPSHPKIEKIMFLRDVVIPYVKEREKEGKVDFDSFECGTTKCLLGWCVASFREELGLPDKKAADLSVDEVMVSLTGKDDGSLGVFWYELFGMNHRGTLDDRKKYCDVIINRMLEEVQDEVSVA